MPLPFLDFIPGAIWFALKFSLVLFILLWLRVTFPRVRPDQLMEFGWKVLLPVALANIFITALVKELAALFLGSCSGKPLIPACLESWTTTAPVHNAIE